MKFITELDAIASKVCAEVNFVGGMSYIDIEDYLVVGFGLTDDDEIDYILSSIA